MEEDILNYLYQLSCFVGHPVFTPDGGEEVDKNIIMHLLYGSIKVAKKTKQKTFKINT